MRFYLLLLLAAFLSPADAASTLYTLNTSSYNSIPNQTDSTPSITATGTRTRPGVLAVSRDILRSGLPYGSTVKVVRQQGCGLNVVGRVFTVEDTMNRTKYRSADIWMLRRSDSIRFGRCVVTFQRI